MCTIYLRGMGGKADMPIKSFKVEKPRYKKPSRVLTWPPSFSSTNHRPPLILTSPRTTHEHTHTHAHTNNLCHDHSMHLPRRKHAHAHRWWCVVIFLFLLYMHTVSPVNLNLIGWPKRHAHTLWKSQSGSIITDSSYWSPPLPSCNVDEWFCYLLCVLFIWICSFWICTIL